MVFDREHLLAAAQGAARTFIRAHYGKEAPFFDACWMTFAARLDEFTRHVGDGRITIEPTTYISLTQRSAMDLVTPVVLATVSETLSEVYGADRSVAQLQDVISKTAARFGASKELTACLARHLPALCIDAMGIKPGRKAAVVSKAEMPQYHVWTGGKSSVVDDLSPYEACKGSVLFWLDLDERTHRSSNGVIGDTAADLLRRLVEHLGRRIPVEQVLQEELGELPSDRQVQRNRIDVQLTKLHKFCGESFREHLFANWFAEGLGLKLSFKDKYFLYRRLRAGQ